MEELRGDRQKNDPWTKKEDDGYDEKEKEKGL